ncbi:MAG: hypothetical protein ACO3CN_00435 [Candidatus Nanopelagicales bacterium]
MADEVVVLTGIKETLTALKEFDKAAVRKFNKVINSELTDAERNARGIVANIETPMSGWRKYDAANPRTRGGAGWPAWNTGVIIAGIRKSKVQGKVRGDYTTSAGALLNKSAAGAIFEVAGRKTAAGFGRTSSSQFLRTLSARFGKASRLIWRVVDKDRAKIEANVKRALDEAKAELQRNLDRERV